MFQVQFIINTNQSLNLFHTISFVILVVMYLFFLVPIVVSFYFFTVFVTLK
jgi:hypothetical protein